MKKHFGVTAYLRMFLSFFDLFNYIPRIVHKLRGFIEWRATGLFPERVFLSGCLFLVADVYVGHRLK